MYYLVLFYLFNKNHNNSEVISTHWLFKNAINNMKKSYENNVNRPVGDLIIDGVHYSSTVQNHVISNLFLKYSGSEDDEEEEENLRIFDYEGEENRSSCDRLMDRYGITPGESKFIFNDKKKRDITRLNAKHVSLLTFKKFKYKKDKYDITDELGDTPTDYMIYTLQIENKTTTMSPFERYIAIESINEKGQWDSLFFIECLFYGLKTTPDIWIGILSKIMINSFNIYRFAALALWSNNPVLWMICRYQQQHNISRWNVKTEQINIITSMINMDDGLSCRENVSKLSRAPISYQRLIKQNKIKNDPFQGLINSQSLGGLQKFNFAL